MAAPIPNEVPTVFRAGETVQFLRGFNDFPPSDGWGYVIYFNGATKIFNKTADVDPGGFKVTLLPSDLAVPAGIYRYLERVSRTVDSILEVRTVGEGVVEIEVDLATAPAGVAVSFAEQMLSLIENEIAARMGADVEEYHSAVAGSSWSVKKIPMEQLLAMRGKYASMVWRQKNPGKIGAPVLVDFVDETNDANFPSTWVDVTGLPGAGQ